MSEELRRKYLALDAEVQGHIHAGLRSAPLHNKRYVRWHATRLAKLQNARDAAKAAWKPPEADYKTRLIAAANGHPDNSSVQAARRLCEKKSINWKLAVDNESDLA